MANVVAGQYGTMFEIARVDKDGVVSEMTMSPEVLIHGIGKLGGRSLGFIDGLKFSVVING